jgi:hypothetical protein
LTVLHCHKYLLALDRDVLNNSFITIIRQRDRIDRCFTVAVTVSP